MKTDAPIILQYHADASIRNLGGIAVYPNEFRKELDKVQGEDELRNRIRQGELLVEAYQSTIFDFLWRVLFGIQRRLSQSPFSFFGSAFLKVLEKNISKVFGGNYPNRPTVLYHHMNNFVFPDHRIIRIARKFNVVMVSSVVDLLEVDYPEYLPNSTKTYRLYVKKWLTKNTKCFLPITHFIEQDARDVGLIPLNTSTEVIEWGTDHIQNHFISIEKNSLINETMIELNVLPSFFLFPAKTWNHKGHLELIKAYAVNPEAKFRLILIGDLGSLQTELEEAISNLDESRRGNIELRGFVEHSTKLQLFKECNAVVLPSCYEGFGFPYFEAAFLGIPFVAFKTKSYLEFFGECDSFFAIENQDYDRFIQVLIEFDSIRASTDVERKMEFVKGLTWSACVKKTLDVYTNVLNGV